MSARLIWVGLLLVAVGILLVVLAACGADNSSEQFREDCERDGGTYSQGQRINSDTCTYNNQEQP